MMGIWKNNPQIETEIRKESPIDISIFRKRGNSKSFSGYLIQKIKEARNQENKELAILLYEIYKKYKEFESEKINLIGWKGKSSIKIFNTPNTFIISTWQKEDQDSDPKEVKTEINKNEVNIVINTLNQLDKGEPIPTRDIGEFAYKKDWDSIFSNRPLHTHLNLILRLLDYYEIIKYRGAKSKVLNKVRIIQEHLNENNNNL